MEVRPPLFMTLKEKIREILSREVIIIRPESPSAAWVPYSINFKPEDKTIDELEALADQIQREAFIHGFKEGFYHSGEGYNGEYVSPRLVGKKIIAKLEEAAQAYLSQQESDSSKEEGGRR